MQKLIKPICRFTYYQHQSVDIIRDFEPLLFNKLPITPLISTAQSIVQNWIWRLYVVLMDFWHGSHWFCVDMQYLLQTRLAWAVREHKKFSKHRSCIHTFPEDAHSLLQDFQMQAGRMHIKLGKAHKQHMMPAMQMDGLQKYPMLQDTVISRP